MTMRHLVAVGPKDVRWCDGPAPQLRGPKGAVIEPLAVSTCDFDHLLVSGAQPAAFPIALGHELVGRVAEIGAEVRNVAVGDIVVVPFQISCGECGPCGRGETAACASVDWLSCYGLGKMSGDWGGALADRVSVPYADAMLVRVPVGLSPVDVAALGCNVVDAYRAVGPGLLHRPGADVLVVGGAFASIALYAVVLARALGAGGVDFFARDRMLVERAERLGARALDSLESIDSMAYPITVDASMDTELLAAAIRATARAGVCTATTMYVAPTTLPLLAMFKRGMTFQTGQPHARAFLDPVLRLVAKGAVNLSSVTDAVVDWSEAPAAFSRGHGKIVCSRELDAPLDASRS